MILQAFCEFAAYGTHVNLLNKRLAAMIKQPIWNICW